MKQADIDSYPIVLTAIEISEILKISKPTAYELMNRHDFPLIKILGSNLLRMHRPLGDFLQLTLHHVV